MESLQKEVVIIVGELGPTSFALYRCAERIGTEIICLFINSSSVVSQKSYSKARIEWCREYEEAIPKIERYQRKFKVSLYPASDEAILICCKFRSNSGVRTLDTHLEPLELLNKDYIGKIAAECGFKRPKTYEINEELDSFPVIVKPQNSLLHGKDEFKIIYNNDEWHRLKDLLIEGVDYIIEEYIEGGATSMFEIIGCYDANDHFLSTVYIKKIEQWPPRIGSSSYIRTSVKIKDMDSRIHDFLARIGYSGLFDLELKHCAKRDEYFYIETNFRAGAPLLLCLLSDSNLLYQWESKKKSEYRVGLSWFNNVTYKLNIRYALRLFGSDVIAIDNSKLRVVFARIRKWIYN